MDAKELLQKQYLSSPFTSYFLTPKQFLELSVKEQQIFTYGYYLSEYHQDARSFGQPRHKDWERERNIYVHEKGYNSCVVCGCRENLEVHHYYPFHLYPELEMKQKYWRTMCDCETHHCHRMIGHLGDWQSFNIRLDDWIEIYKNKPYTRI